MGLSKGRSGSSSSSLVTPSSDFSTSSFESRSTEDAQWSDPRTPLKTQKDNWSSLVIDSGYAGELPSGGDGSTPYSKWKYSSRVKESVRRGFCEAEDPWKV